MEISDKQIKQITSALKQEAWNKKKTTLEAGSGVRFTHRKTQHVIDVFKDNRAGDYCYYDNTDKEIIRRAPSVGTVATDMVQLGDKEAPKMGDNEFNYLIDDFKLINTPAQKEGNCGNDWNLFKSSPAMRILQGDELSKPYKRPWATIEFYEHVIPNKREREYYWGFWRKKLTDFTQSSTVFILISETHGAGKGFMMSHLNEMMSVNPVSYSSFISPFNQWIDESYIQVLNEIGTKCSTDLEKEVFYEMLKEYSEPGKMKITRKNLVEKDIFNLNTFIITTNKDPFLLNQDSDRRLTYYWLPNQLLETSELLKKYDGSITDSDLDGTDELFEQMKLELEDFAYYLRENTDFNISSKDYKKPPQNDYIKKKLIYDRPAMDTILEALKDKEYDMLIKLALRNDRELDKVVDGWDEGKISKPAMYSLLHEYEKEIDLSHKLQELYGKTNSTQWTSKSGFGRLRGYYFPELKDWVQNNLDTYNEYSVNKIHSDVLPTHDDPFGGLKL